MQWKEILTVYAVKTTTGTENSMDAVTMDEAHFAVLHAYAASPDHLDRRN